MEKTPWNPSKKAIKRVKNPLPSPECCPYCNGGVIKANNKEVYNGRSYGEWPYVYMCIECDAHVGMHPYTDIPLGTLANKETRNARKQCKEPFEALHRTGKLTRKDAYQRLADKLGIPKEECHFGWFDTAMCHKAAKAAREIYLGV